MCQSFSSHQFTRLWSILRPRTSTSQLIPKARGASYPQFSSHHDPLLPTLTLGSMCITVPIKTSDDEIISSKVKCVNGKLESFCGICWTHSTGGEIEKLNLLVRQKVESFVADSIKTGEPLPVEVQAVITGNVTIYKERWMWVPLAYSFLSASMIVYHSSSPVTVLVAAVFSFLWYDFFSGVLHIVLDNPEFVNFPVLCDPCLEFQWHHHIPSDLACKPFLQVCGDLNLVMTIILSAYLLPTIGFGYRTPMALSLVSCKMLMAYFGQLCHCMSHMPPHNRPNWVTYLQNNGFMISSREHMIHHASYNDNFCIGSGACNGIISWGKNITSNKWFWLILFLFSLFADVPVANYLLCNFAGFK